MAKENSTLSQQLSLNFGVRSGVVRKMVCIFPVKKFTASTLMPLAACAAFATVPLAADPVKAFSLTIDNFTTPLVTSNTIGVGSKSSGVSSPVSGGGIIPGATRTQSLDTSCPVAPCNSNTLSVGDAGGGAGASLSLAQGTTGTGTITYAFNQPLDLTGLGYDSFSYDFNVDGSATLGFSVNGGSSGTATYSESYTNFNGTDTVLFTDFSGSQDAFGSINSITFSIQGTSPSADANVNFLKASSPTGVPVPPAFLGTILGGVVAALRSLKKKSEASA